MLLQTGGSINKNNLSLNITSKEPDGGFAWDAAIAFAAAIEKVLRGCAVNH